MIVVLILVLYYYTAETFEVVEVVGRHVYAIVKEVAQNIQEPVNGEAVGDNILERMVKKVKSVFD